MKHSLRPWLLCLACASALVTAAAARPLAKFEPEHGCYLGAFIEKDARALGDYGQFEHLVGHKHACYITYLGYGQPFPTAWVARVKSAGACPHIALEPNGGLNGVNDDAYLRHFARECGRSRVPIFLRFASEMNGAWMPYSGDCELYKQKWRLVYRVMQDEAPNVAMVWCVFSMPQRTIMQYYPGDDYVDWVGVNIYSVMYHNNDPSQPAQREDPRDWLRFVYDLYAGRKPIMICEYAATSWCRVVDGPTVGFALEKMAALYNSLPREFPRVKCVQWFSWDTVTAGAADNNYSVTGDPIVAAKYRELTAGDYWLGAVQAVPELLQGAPYDRALVAAVPGPPKPATPDVPPVLGPPTPVSAPPAEPLKPAAEPPAEDSPDAEAMALRPLRSEFGLRGLKPGQVVMHPVEISTYVPPEWPVRYIALKINGRTVFATNRSPYTYVWDPAGLEPGRYILCVQLRRAGHEEPVLSPPLEVEVRRRPGAGR